MTIASPPVPTISPATLASSRANATQAEQIPESPSVATVAVAVRHSDDGSAFGVACGDFSVAVVGDADRSEMAALIDAFEFILVHPHFEGQHIDILVANEGFASAVAALLAAWPHINIVTVPGSGYLMHRAGRMAHRILHPESAEDEPAVALADMPRLTCATDGSAGYARNPLGAYAWITESGEHGGAVIGNVSARVAELAAVTALIEAMPAARPLRVLIDCREVLNLVNSLNMTVACGSEDFSSMIAPWNGRYAHRLIAALAGRDVIFEKVAAHDGHPLNETADSLAVYLRRVEQMKIPGEVAASVVDRIVAEGLWAWSESEANRKRGPLSA